MSLALLFWIVYVIAFVSAGWAAWPVQPRSFGPSFIVLVLIGLLGYAQFGALVHR
jgi:hypothetical protein